MENNVFTGGFPSQMKSYRDKTEKWRKQCVNWAKSQSYSSQEYIRNTIKHKTINYNLINGKIDLEDLKLILNPEDVVADYIPNNIQHYPLINSKINVLRGEESKRLFDFRVIITNPNAISEIEDKKKNEFFQKFKEIIENQSLGQQEYQDSMKKLSDYYNYEYQDFREIRANSLLNHYWKEQNIPKMFNDGIVDAMAVAEEIYQCDIEGGEPIIRKLNPKKIRSYKYGYSSKIEDASIVVIEDYFSVSKVVDMYYDVLTTEQLKKLENHFDNITTGMTNSDGSVDERYGMHKVNLMVTEDGLLKMNDNNQYFDEVSSGNMPYDMNGNVRVIRIYWKSKRKIKKVKRYDVDTGEEDYQLFPEDYKCDKSMGEEEESLWINEAWEGTLIADDIYINMRPRPIQYNSLGNPSKCHFGIIGQIYNINGSEPYSMVDMMKPYNYMYDVIHDRLNKLIARNWGMILKLDFAKIPKGWDVNKWMYYAMTMGIAVEDSFKAGTEGPATNKIVGGLNNNSNGVIQAELGNSINNYINLLEFIKQEMSEVVGITKQREGQVAASETVGGVERANLQSTYITEWLFTVHEDLKKRVLECFLETAKIALKGKNKKFQYILADHSLKIMDIDGDEFSECDYGLVVDASQNSQKLNQNLETLAQAALQNQMITFGDMMKLYSSSSLAEKQRLIETSEKQKQEQTQQQLQMQQQQLQMQEQTKMQIAQQEIDLKRENNIRDNETKIQIAEINAQGNRDYLEAQMEIHSAKGEHDGKVLEQKSKESDRKYEEQRRQFDEKMKNDRIKLNNKTK